MFSAIFFNIMLYFILFINLSYIELKIVDIFLDLNEFIRKVCNHIFVSY